MVVATDGLKIYPTSGLSFAWCEYHPDGKVGSFDAVLGPDGCTLTMLMLIYWEDLGSAFQQLLGYSWRDPTGGPGATPCIRRKIPWRHPYTNHLFVRNIASVKGAILREMELIVNPGLVSIGSNAGVQNTGPWSTFEFAILTLHFWRPPYYVRSDTDVQDADGVQREYLRYVDRHWTVNSQMLTREGQTFVFSPGQGVSSGKQFQGAVSLPVTHLRLSRRWHEIPAQCLFSTTWDGTPSGIPTNLLLTRTPTTNPITNWAYLAGQTIGNTVNSPFGGGTDDSDVNKRFFGCPMGTLRLDAVEILERPLQLPPALMQIAGFGFNEPIAQQQYDVVFHWDWFDPPRDLITGQIVADVSVLDGGSGYTSIPPTVSFSGGGTPTRSAAAHAEIAGGSVTYVFLDDSGAGYTSTPSVSIAAPGGGGSTAGAVALMESVTEPNKFRGHNLMPFSGNGLWYAVQSQQGPITTPFQYADFQDLFLPL